MFNEDDICLQSPANYTRRVQDPANYNFCIVPESGYDAVFFVAVAFLITCVTSAKLSAVWVLITGVITEAIAYYNNLGRFGNAISLWLGMQPAEIFFYVFLPPLLLDSAVRTDFFLFRKVLVQVLLFAFLMVAASTFLMVPVMLLGLQLWEQGWRWQHAALFATMLSSTDAVAVSASLKNGGAPELLSVLIEGESLFNDATSIVLFDVFRRQVAELGSAADPRKMDSWQEVVEVLQEVAWLASGGVIVGLVAGILTRNLFRLLQNQGKKPAVEVVVTLSACYLVFYVANSYLGASGVIAVVIYGLYGAGSKQWDLSTKAMKEEWFEKVWDTVGFATNGLVFFYTGVSATNFFIRSYQELYANNWLGAVRDLASLPLIYVASFGIRGVLIAICAPLASWISPGSRLDRKGIAFATVCGLRGAVSLIMAQIVVTMHHQHDAGSDRSADGVKAQMALWTAGFVVMTLLINAPLIEPLMRWLQLNEVSAARSKIRRKAELALIKYTRTAVDDLQNDEDEILRGVDWVAVKKYCDLSSYFQARRPGGKRRPVEQVEEPPTSFKPSTPSGMVSRLGSMLGPQDLLRRSFLFRRSFLSNGSPSTGEPLLSPPSLRTTTTDVEVPTLERRSLLRDSIDPETHNRCMAINQAFADATGAQSLPNSLSVAPPFFVPQAGRQPSLLSLGSLRDGRPVSWVPDVSGEPARPSNQHSQLSNSSTEANSQPLFFQKAPTTMCSSQSTAFNSMDQEVSSAQQQESDAADWLSTRSASMLSATSRMDSMSSSRNWPTATDSWSELRGSRANTSVNASVNTPSLNASVNTPSLAPSVNASVNMPSLHASVNAPWLNASVGPPVSVHAVLSEATALGSTALQVAEQAQESEPAAATATVATPTPFANPASVPFTSFEPNPPILSSSPSMRPQAGRMDSKTEADSDVASSVSQHGKRPGTGLPPVLLIWPTGPGLSFGLRGPDNSSNVANCALDTPSNGAPYAEAGLWTQRGTPSRLPSGQPTPQSSRTINGRALSGKASSRAEVSRLNLLPIMGRSLESPAGTAIPCTSVRSRMPPESLGRSSQPMNQAFNNNFYKAIDSASSLSSTPRLSFVSESDEALVEYRIRLLTGFKRYFHAKHREGLLSSKGIRILDYCCDLALDEPQHPINLWTQAEKELLGRWIVRVQARLHFYLRSIIIHFHRCGYWSSIFFAGPIRLWAHWLAARLNRRTLVALEVAMELWLALTASPQANWLAYAGKTATPLQQEVHLQAEKIWRFIIDREIEAPERFRAIQSHRAMLAVLQNQSAFVARLFDCGMIDEAELERLEQPIEERLRKLRQRGPAWKQPMLSQVIRNVPFLADVPQHVLEWVLGQGELRMYKQGDCLFTEQFSQAPGIYIVISGILMVHVERGNKMKEYYMGMGGVAGLLKAMVEVPLAGAGVRAAHAQGNTLGQGPVVFHLPQQAVRQIRAWAVSGEPDWLSLETSMFRLSAILLLHMIRQAIMRCLSHTLLHMLKRTDRKGAPHRQALLRYLLTQHTPDVAQRSSAARKQQHQQQILDTVFDGDSPASPEPDTPSYNGTYRNSALESGEVNVRQAQKQATLQLHGIEGYMASPEDAEVDLEDQAVMEAEAQDVVGELSGAAPESDAVQEVKKKVVSSCWQRANDMFETMKRQLRKADIVKLQPGEVLVQHSSLVLLSGQLLAVWTEAPQSAEEGGNRSMDTGLRTSLSRPPSLRLPHHQHPVYSPCLLTWLPACLPIGPTAWQLPTPDMDQPYEYFAGPDGAILAVCPHDHVDESDEDEGEEADGVLYDTGNSEWYDMDHTGYRPPTVERKLDYEEEERGTQSREW